MVSILSYKKSSSEQDFRILDQPDLVVTKNANEIWISMPIFVQIFDWNCLNLAYQKNAS